MAPPGVHMLIDFARVHQMAIALMCTHAPLSLSHCLSPGLWAWQCINQRRISLLVFFTILHFSFSKTLQIFSLFFCSIRLEVVSFFSGWSEIYCEINGCERAVMQRDRVEGGRARAGGRGRGTQFTMQTSGK